MRVLLVNGSSRKNGCTNAALCEVERALKEEGIETEGLMTMYNIGKNMAWLLKCIAIGKENGLIHPDNEKVLTNFTR